ncbi:MAG TPA: RDD family protein [Vicinamibacterales bacterium]|nr:RDD family protein [Vicinamibacterales bacterium]
MKRSLWCATLLVFASLGRCQGLVAQTKLPGDQAGTGQQVAGQPEVEAVRHVYPWRQVLRIGQDFTLRPDDSARELAVIFGDAGVEGHVANDVIVVFGSAHVASTARIDGSLVAVGGHVRAESGAMVGSDLVVIGGTVDAPADFSPGGNHIVVGPAALGSRLQALVPWLTRGLLWGRPIVPELPWVWAVAGMFFLVYLALALVFHAPVGAAAATLAARPLTAFLVGLLVLLLTGPVSVLLAVSVIGIAVVPFVIGAIVVAGIVGRVAVTRWIGMRIVPEENVESRVQTIRSFLIGAAAITLVYMVPVLGLLAWTMLGVLGLGGVTLAFIAGYRRENPLLPRRRSAEPVPPAPVVRPTAADLPSLPENGAAMFDATAAPSASPNPQAATSLTDLAAFPRAGFLERLSAFVLDVILVLIVRELFDLTDRDSTVFLLLLGYHIGFWTWKGTTVGGIICQLRLVRVDGAPLRFVDALVRGLSAIFSLAVVGIGALWILRDPERQSWHDKIAGTYVVRVPRNFPL